MSLFSSRREKRLWLWTFAIVVAIYASLGLAGELASALRDRDILSDAIWVGLFLIAATVVALTLKTRVGGAEIGVALGVVAVYLIVLTRMGLPEERSHIIEYSVVAAFIYEALIERANNGRNVPMPALIALVATASIGALDELIQLLLPNRVFDVRDIGFNALAGMMAIGAALALNAARNWWSRRDQ